MALFSTLLKVGAAVARVAGRAAARTSARVARATARAAFRAAKRSAPAKAAARAARNTATRGGRSRAAGTISNVAGSRVRPSVRSKVFRAGRRTRGGLAVIGGTFVADKAIDSGIGRAITGRNRRDR